MCEVTKQSIVSLAIAAAASLAMACGGHQAAAPNAPSTAPSVSAPGSGAIAGATISGTVVGMSASSASGRLRTLGVPLTVTVTGTTSSTPVDSSGHFTLQNVPAGHVDLHFVGNGIDAHLGLDDVVERAAITITVVVNGSNAELDNDQREDPDNTVEIEGLVSATSASTLTVNGKMITVNPATVIVHGDQTIAFASVKNGDRVHVKGTPTTVGGLAAILATTIKVQNVAAPPVVTPPPTGNGDGSDDGDKNEAEVSGAVAGKAGTCPAISFTIGATSVTTSATTEFKGATCAALANGTKVEVKGTKQSSGVAYLSA
jgi:hypothetical protein